MSKFKINSDHNGIHETSETEDIVGGEPGPVVRGKKDLDIWSDI